MHDSQKRLEHLFKILFIYYCYLEGWDININEKNIKIKQNKDNIPNIYYQQTNKFDTKKFMLHNHLVQ